MNYLDYRNPKNAAATARFWNKALDRADWYSIENRSKEAEIFIFDVVGYPFISAETFAKDLDKIKVSPIICRINSPGGDVFEGLAVASALKNHPSKIITRIEGIAASIASVIALAGDKFRSTPGRC